MKKLTKVSLIVFAVGLVGLGITIGAVIGGGKLISRDKDKVIEITEDTEKILLSINKAHLKTVESDDNKIELKLNLWADKDINVEDVALTNKENGVLTITEQAPNNKFFGMFSQPYELIITVYAPQSILSELEWRQVQ